MLGNIALLPVSTGEVGISLDPSAIQFRTGLGNCNDGTEDVLFDFDGRVVIVFLELTGATKVLASMAGMGEERSEEASLELEFCGRFCQSGLEKSELILEYGCEKLAVCEAVGMCKPVGQ